MCIIGVYQTAPGALLSAGRFRPPTPATIDAWSPTSASSLDNVHHSLSNYIAGLHGALPYNFPALTDTPEGVQN